MKYLLENEGFSEQVKAGFMLCLLASDRPLHEMIAPNFQDQLAALSNQFAGMTAEDFTYENFEQARAALVEAMRAAITSKDKEFLLSVHNVTPDWSIYNYERFPAVQWKLQNLQKLKTSNPDKHREQYEALKDVLEN